MSEQLFCLGFGFTAERLAAQLQPLGWTIAGTSRDTERREALSAKGFTAIDPADDGAFERTLFSANKIVISASPGRGEDPFLRRVAVLLKRNPHKINWIGYLSTTGVYGVRDGGWVDESMPPEPILRRGELRLIAEQGWQKLATSLQVPCFIFRIAGIYGPGRNALKQLREGTAKRIIKPGQVFNRIHVDDIVRTIMAGIALHDHAGIYNIADDMPAPPQDVIAYAAKLMGIEPPPETPFNKAELSPMAASFYEENKRTRNNRIKSRLGVKLQYPSYREGLEAIYASGEL